MKKSFAKDPYVLLFDVAITQILRWIDFTIEEERVTCFFGKTSYKPKIRALYERRRLRDKAKGFLGARNKN